MDTVRIADHRTSNHRKQNYEMSLPDHHDCFRSLVQARLELLDRASRRRLQIVQAGAGDGITGDFLHEFIRTTDCAAILVEPFHPVFERLAATWSGTPRVVCLNAALADSNEQRELFSVRPDPSLPWFAEQLPSFHKKVVLSHVGFIPDLADRLQSHAVSCITPQELLNSSSVNQVDVLATDTEGHDAEIVRGFFSAGIRPRILLFEHKHLSRPALHRLMGNLHGVGYNLVKGPDDYLCWMPDSVIQATAISPADIQMPDREP